MAKKNIATFTGPQKGISIIGEHYYALSGIVNISNTETTMLEFQTGKYYCVGEWRGDYYENASDDVRFLCYFNNQLVSSMTTTSNKPPIDYAPIIIPPLTLVILTGQNITDTSALDMMVAITGRVYDQ